MVILVKVQAGLNCHYMSWLKRAAPRHKTRVVRVHAQIVTGVVRVPDGRVLQRGKSNSFP